MNPDTLETDTLLQDLWLHQTPDVAVSAITITPNRVTVRAATTSTDAVCPSCGVSPGGPAASRKPGRVVGSSRRCWPVASMAGCR